ncbi:MAG: hypothetical protein IPP48_00360 [Chitinophagaceae bacterium]|nr:hypothetical protein [Chitinophagaceae bacterium]
MKILSTLIVVLFISITSFAQNFENAGEYIGYIGKQQESITKKYLSYSSAVAHGKRARKVESLRSKLMDEVQEARMNINAMPSFKGDKGYRDSSVKFMKFYFNVLNDDYSKIINLEDVAEQSYDDMEAYILAQEMVDKKLKEANDMIKAAQLDFGKKYNINIIEDKSELGKMAEQVHNTNEYFHKIYLLFFKASFQEENLMKAIEKGNITGIEQSKSSLLKYAQEGLEKVNEIKPFEGDNSLIASFKAVMNFYVKEVNDKMKTISDFFLTNERFEALKKEMDKKGDNRTQADIDAYNKSVNEINAASNKYNQNNKQLFEMRKEVIDNWNDASNDFFNEHTPRYK